MFCNWNTDFWEICWTENFSADPCIIYLSIHLSSYICQYLGIYSSFMVKKLKWPWFLIGALTFITFCQTKVNLVNTKLSHKSFSFWVLSCNDKYINLTIPQICHDRCVIECQGHNAQWLAEVPHESDLLIVRDCLSLSLGYKSKTAWIK